MKSTVVSDNSLLAEAERVELTSRAGGYKTKTQWKAEEMLANSTTAPEISGSLSATCFVWFEIIFIKCYSIYAKSMEMKYKILQFVVDFQSVYYINIAEKGNTFIGLSYEFYFNREIAQLGRVSVLGPRCKAQILFSRPFAGIV